MPVFFCEQQQRRSNGQDVYALLMLSGIAVNEQDSVLSRDQLSSGFLLFPFCSVYDVVNVFR